MNLPILAFEHSRRELEGREDAIVGDLIRHVLDFKNRPFTPNTMNAIETIKNRARHDMQAIGGNEQYLELVINSLTVSL